MTSSDYAKDEEALSIISSEGAVEGWLHYSPQDRTNFSSEGLTNLNFLAMMRKYNVAEVEAPLQDLKKYLSSTPILVAPKPQEPLLLYLAATNQVVSAALVAQREVDEEAVATAGPADGEPKIPPAGPGAGKARPPAESDATEAVRAQSVEVVQKKKMMQHPVYLVSSLLQGARSRYSGVQKLLFGLLMASRKLRHYFQAHEITIVTHLPLQRILHNPDATGRIVEGPWSCQVLV